jgi:hypothetical protein
MIKRLGVTIAALLSGGLAYSQTPNPVPIQSSGVVRVGHEVVHAGTVGQCAGTWTESGNDDLSRDVAAVHVFGEPARPHRL